ncbi:carboxyl-terminal-processing peptidase 1, chloroplastic [Dorcoceras hygrometricum]|uniref:Carboxyl-terminal-processing peptidase 1, chloroplastic n=1 Tax=Dorcoceras hygrometricum TaxID=472368 RepID=A0A2Z7B695_9LAMI|nr:carboxyl-terminal-processing peptidase 1, chloroplastic [Dorcoceras hygrometricum]
MTAHRCLHSAKRRVRPRAQHVRTEAATCAHSAGRWAAGAAHSKSGPRLKSRLLRQSALEKVMNLSRTESPRRGGWNKSNHGNGRRTAAGGARVGGRRGEGDERLATSPHDPLGTIDSACKNQLVMVSIQYGPFNTYIPIRSTTIGKSRVARDPITIHTSRRSNSDITCVTSIGYPRTKASGESSTTKHRLLHASGPHPIPIRSMTIDLSSQAFPAVFAETSEGAYWSCREVAMPW